MNQPIPGGEIVQERPLTFKLLTAGLVLLFLALGFNALLTYGSLEKLYVESIVSSYQVIGKDLQRKLDQSLRFGKNIQKFIGMNQLLEETKAHPQSVNSPKQEIQLAYEESEYFHILSVSDDGKGLRQDDSERLFRPFQRHETSREVEGAGLGLTIVKEIAEQHGSKVWVEPRTPKGTTFCLSISKSL